MPAPKLPDELRRSKTVQIQVTPPEKARLLEAVGRAQDSARARGEKLPTESDVCRILLLAGLDTAMSAVPGLVLDDVVLEDLRSLGLRISAHNELAPFVELLLTAASEKTAEELSVFVFGERDAQVKEQTRQDRAKARRAGGLRKVPKERV